MTCCWIHLLKACLGELCVCAPRYVERRCGGTYFYLIYWYLIENNTFFEFIKLSFLKVILSLYIQSFLSSYCSTFYYVHKVLFYKNGSLLCWTVVLFSRLKLYCKRKYHRFESCFSRAYLQPALLRRHFSNDWLTFDYLFFSIAYYYN